MAYQWIAAGKHQDGDRNGYYERRKNDQRHRGGDAFHTGQHWIGRNADGIRLLSSLISFLFQAGWSHGYRYPGRGHTVGQGSPPPGNKICSITLLSLVLLFAGI